MKQQLKKHRRVVGVVGGLAALMVAVIYLKVTPFEVVDTSTVLGIIVLYSHSLCWIFLSIASFMWGFKGNNKVSHFLLYIALGTYIIFICTMFLSQFS